MLTILEYIMDTLNFSTNASRLSDFKIVQKKNKKHLLLKLSKLKESKREDLRRLRK